MTDLTSQWKKGELPAEDDKHQWLAYYIKHKDGHIHADSRFMGQWGIADSDSIEQILAPVPSYEEYEQLENWNRFTADYHALREAKEIADYEKVELLEKVKQLKELLKECRNSLEEQSNVRKLYESDVEYRDRYNKKMDLLIKIDEVLNA